MAFNVAKPSVEVPLSTFAGLVTEMSPTDLPEGVSPDNQDVVYVPGSVSSRPALQRVFATPFPTADPAGLVPTLAYAKSYVANDGTSRNLSLDSNGSLWVENISLAPGAYTLLLNLEAGRYAKSVTAFGREYIAVSDGLHGQDVPLQYDGTYIDRVTQDGPGASPTVTNTVLAALNITSLTRAANVVTAVTASAHHLQVGYQAQIAGPAAHAIGGGITSIVIKNETLPGIATVTTSTEHGLTPGVFVGITGVGSAITGGGISAVSCVNQIATFTTATAHGLQPGAFVQILGTAAFDGGATVLQVISPTVFSIAATGATNTTAGAAGTLGALAPQVGGRLWRQVLRRALGNPGLLRGAARPALRLQVARPARSFLGGAGRCSFAARPADRHRVRVGGAGRHRDRRGDDARVAGQLRASAATVPAVRPKKLPSPSEIPLT